MSIPWVTELNSLTTRKYLASLYGGSPHSGGIVPADKSANVFLFSDPAAGEKYGYNYDSIASDGTVYYTGQGRVGDQSESGLNGSVIHHLSMGRHIRLFVADGTVVGSGTKLQRYVGEYRIDEAAPFRREAAPDANQETRTVVVFKLLPVGKTSAALTPLAGNPAGELSTPSARLVPPEVASTLFYESSGSEPTTAEMRETKLVEEFRSWLGVPSYSIKRWAITVPGSKIPLLSDIYDSTTHTLYEAKASSARNDIRMAVGQLLDYQRHIPVPNLACSLLLPMRPTSDLVDFAHYAGMQLAFRTKSASFDRLLIPFSQQAERVSPLGI